MDFIWKVLPFFEVVNWIFVTLSLINFYYGVGFLMKLKLRFFGGSVQIPMRKSRIFHIIVKNNDWSVLLRFYHE